jgi:hypothetical protein
VHRRTHPDEALRTSLGILRLAHDFSTGALERACEHALEFRTYSYRAIRTLIVTPPTPAPEPSPTPAHANVRGARYFT